MFYLVRGVLFRDRGEDLVAMLLTGIVFWRWFDSTIRRACNSVIAHTRIATQAYLPKLVVPMIAINAMGRRFLIILALYLVYLLFAKGGVPSTAGWFPLLLFVQFLLVVGLSIFLSAVVPFLPDLKIIIGNGLTLLFFASGIFFDISGLDEGTRQILYLNPMAYMIEAYRMVLVVGGPPEMDGLVYSSLFGLFFLILGCYLHQRYDMHYPKVLTSM